MRYRLQRVDCRSYSLVDLIEALRIAGGQVLSAATFSFGFEFEFTSYPLSVCQLCPSAIRRLRDGEEHQSETT
jgi:hypothetical protein